MKIELTPDQRKKFQILIVKSTDDKMNFNENKEFRQLINSFEECKHEWEQMKKMKVIIQSLRFFLKRQTEGVWYKYWENVSNRIDCSLNLIFLTTSIITFSSFEGL